MGKTLDKLRQAFKFPPSDGMKENFFDLIRAGEIDAVKKILDCYPDAANWEGIHGWRPLLYAAQKHHSKIVQLLLDHGADIKATNLNGDTALHVALQTKGDIHTARMLVLYGANFNTQNRADGRTPLVNALYAGQIDIIEEFVDKAVDHNVRDRKGRTLAMLYVSSALSYLGHPTIPPEKAFAVLIPDDADLYIKDNDGKTVIDHARSMSNNEVRGLLEKRLAAIEKTTAAASAKKRNASIAAATDFSRGLKEPMALPPRPKFLTGSKK